MRVFNGKSVLVVAWVLAALAGCGGAGNDGSQPVELATPSNPSLAAAAAAGAAEPHRPTESTQALGDGSLSGTVSAATTAANLTSVGTSDWAHWGDGVPGLVRKASGGSQISAYSVVNSGNPTAFPNSPRALSWSDGTPTASSSANTTGIYLSGGGGYSITVPAGTTARTVTLYVGGWNSGATLVAHLSDGSALDYTDVNAATSEVYVRAYTLTYRAASANQSLTLTWTRTAGTGNIDLNAVALGAPVVVSNQPPTVQTPGAQSGTVGQALTLSLSASDPDADTLSYSATGLPAGLAINASTGVISGTPSAAATYSVNATVSDGRGGTATASFGWVIQAVSSGSSLLTGSASSATTAANLTTVGSIDWAHWGDGVPGLVRKASGGSQIGAYTVVNSGGPTAFPNALRVLSWSDGTPTASNSANTTGLYLSGGGFSVTVPASTTTRTVTLYVGGWNSGATLTAHLSDSSAGDYTDVTAAVADQYVRNYTLTYRAASANQSLTLTWARSAGTGNVDLNAVALGTPVVASNQPPTVQTPAAQAGMVGQAATLAISASDPDADALSYSATGLPIGLSLNASSGLISGTPSAAGTYAPSVSVSDGRGGSASASFGWVIQAAPVSGSVLTGTVSTANSAVVLSTVGSTDWAHWGDGVPGIVRKSGGGSLISAYTVLLGNTPSSYNNDLRALSWSGGTPTASSTANTNGLYVANTGNGFSLSVPASTTRAAVTVYVGGWASSATLRAHLSDGSAPDYTNTTATATGQYVRAYTLNFAAASAGQRLVITWTQASAGGNVTLNGVALGAATASTNRAPTVVTPAAQTDTQGTAISFGISASDADGDTLSYSASGLPAGLSINAGNGVISGTPTTVASYSTAVVVSDGKGGSATASFAWTIAASAPPTSGSGLDARPSNTSCVAPARPQAGTGVQLARVFPNLSFNLPVGMYQAPGDSSRWYVIEQQSGLVRSFPNSQTAVAGDVKTFIDLFAKIQIDSEMGLLGLAFHPNWPSTPYAYLYYSTGNNPIENHVSRFTSTDGGATLDTTTEQVLLRLVKNQNDRNHNGGNVVFGPDGYLYIGTGDGGGGGDPNANSQNRNVLFGKMLRIDVSPASGYAIPSTNPFAANAKCTNGSGGAACPEIFANGLRNPWRWSFDKSTGDLWVGDVGQDQREEVDVVTRGGNYGWRTREGSTCYNATSCATTGAFGEALIDPLVEYDHSVGQAITGGYVYRGTQVPSLAGKYVFGDYVSSRIFAFTPPSPLVAATPRAVLTASNAILNSPQNITSFAQGNDGELYVVGYGGALYQLQASGAAVDTIPTLLSQTGCVASGNATQPAAGLVPYGVNAPFWSDGADKQRWLAVPNGTSITPQTPGRWTPPNGTVLVKNFKLNNLLIETRLLMRHPDGVWAGYTYEWNAAQTDATRVVGGKSKLIGTQTWLYPSESDCLQCHTQVAGRTLGLETAQLNGNITYATTGRTANQITTLNSIGLLSPTLAGTPATWPAYVDPHGTAGTVEQRARAFLHANCSQCHQPNGPTPVALDLRYTTALAQTGTCNATPTSGDLGITNAKVISPGAPDSSVLLSRINRRDSFAMPPLGSTLVDTQSVAVVRQWIQGLTACP